MDHTWQAIGGSVVGAMHLQAGLPNQDAIDWYPKAKPGPPLLVAVADGHGSHKSFRSHIGARLAVKVAKKAVKDVLKGDLSKMDLSQIKHQWEDNLPRQLVRDWQTRVNAHLSKNPMTDAELQKLTSKGAANSLASLEENPLVVYGATLITILVTEGFIAYAQLGDGDILTVSDEGQVNRPLPDDERLFANETTSLCLRSAWSDFRTSFEVITQSPPALILTSTDGYSNSFVDESNFRKVGSDLLTMTRAEGLPKIAASINGWLEQASREGSGDDITLGMICRMDALQGGE